MVGSNSYTYNPNIFSFEYNSIALSTAKIDNQFSKAVLNPLIDPTTNSINSGVTIQLSSLIPDIFSSSGVWKDYINSVNNLSILADESLELESTVEDWFGSLSDSSSKLKNEAKLM